MTVGRCLLWVSPPVGLQPSVLGTTCGTFFEVSSLNQKLRRWGLEQMYLLRFLGKPRLKTYSCAAKYTADDCQNPKAQVHCPGCSKGAVLDAPPTAHLLRHAPSPPTPQVLGVDAQWALSTDSCHPGPYGSQTCISASRRTSAIDMNFLLNWGGGGSFSKLVCVVQSEIHLTIFRLLKHRLFILRSDHLPFPGGGWMAVSEDTWPDPQAPRGGRPPWPPGTLPPCAHICPHYPRVALQVFAHMEGRGQRHGALTMSRRQDRTKTGSVLTLWRLRPRRYSCQPSEVGF
uniref:Uncharacterized protein n=1 Tax=Molossus molossus TaxID=27622 RepID=A0A7J8HBQ1_MOLMO|nr:hypothetical protein HJG59_011094 [Molossus molossus]